MSLLKRARARVTEQRSEWGSSAIPGPGSVFAMAGSGYVGSSDSAMRHAAVYACVRLIADTISTFPVDAYQGESPAQLSESKKLTKPPILVKPSDYLSGVQWVHQVMMSLLLQGNAYGLISSSDRLGYPTQIDLIDPQWVSVSKSNGDDTTPTGRRIPSGRKIFKVKGATLTSNEVWHCPGPMMPGDLAGLSPVKYAARVIGMGIEAEQFSLDFYRNGTHPTSVVETDQAITKEDADLIKQRIADATAGRGTPVLGLGAKLRPWQVTPQDAALLESQQYNTLAVCRLFGVPPEMIGAAMSGTSVTYANREQRAQDFLTYAINPWLARLEDAFSGLFPRTTFVKFDTKSLLKSDLKTRYEAWKIGIDGGWLEEAEARAFEDLPPLPDSEDTSQESRDVFEAVQKIYLGVVNKVLTADEARTLLNRVGADLTVPGPDELTAKPDPMFPPDAPAGAPDQGPME